MIILAALFRYRTVEGQVLFHGSGEVRDQDVLVVAVRDGDAARAADGLVGKVLQMRRIAAEGAGVSPPRAVTARFPVRPGMTEDASSIHLQTASSETKVVRK